MTAEVLLITHYLLLITREGFVKPKTGETLWYLIPRVNTNWLNLVYQQFAIDAQINSQKKFF